MSFLELCFKPWLQTSILNLYQSFLQIKLLLNNSQLGLTYHILVERVILWVLGGMMIVKNTLKEVFQIVFYNFNNKNLI